jgi:hypothetical protein
LKLDRETRLGCAGVIVREFRGKCIQAAKNKKAGR